MQERIKAILQREPSEEIVKAENLDASEDDINAEYDRLAKAYNMEADVIKKSLPADAITGDIKSRKAIELIKDNAVITEEKATAKKTAEKKEPAEKKPAAKKKADTAAKEDKPAAKKPAAKKTAKKKADEE